MINNTLARQFSPHTQLNYYKDTRNLDIVSLLSQFPIEWVCCWILDTFCANYKDTRNLDIVSLLSQFPIEWVCCWILDTFCANLKRLEPQQFLFDFSHFLVFIMHKPTFNGLIRQYITYNNFLFVVCPKAPSKVPVFWVTCVIHVPFKLSTVFSSAKNHSSVSLTITLGD